MDISRPDHKVQKVRRRLIWIVAAVGFAVAALLAIMTLTDDTPRVKRASVWIDTVKRGAMLREVRGPGVLVPIDARWVAASSNARVERILIRPGADVHANSVIMRLSDPELGLKLQAAKAQVVAAEADLIAREVALDNQLLDLRAAAAASASRQQSAQMQADAEREIAARGVVSALQAKRSELSAELAKTRLNLDGERIRNFRRNMAAQLRAEQTRLAQLRSTLELREGQVQALDVRAGLAGVLQLVAVEEGQQVSSGANLARVARADLLMAVLEIAETQAQDLRVDLPARIDTRNGIVAGRVSRISPAVQGGTVQVDVTFKDALPPGARPDLSVDGIIEIERLANVLNVGRPAAGTQQGSLQLFVLTNSGEAVATQVTLGRASLAQVEIVAGLQLGDQVVLSDTSQWARRARIRIE